MARLFLICGHSFAGKTTLGRALSERFGVAEVDVDATKAEMFGPEVSDDLLMPEVWDRVYAETDARIARLLRAGHPVVDASRNFQKAERRRAREVASGAGGEVVTIFVDTPEAVVRRRLLENRRTRERVDWSDAHFDGLIQAMEPPGADETPLIFHYRDDIGDWLTAHIAPLLPGETGENVEE